MGYFNFILADRQFVFIFENGVQVGCLVRKNLFVKELIEWLEFVLENLEDV
jgi:hypothetical protein